MVAEACPICNRYPNNGCDNAPMVTSVKLITPIAMSENLNFAIREGGKTVGAGVVTKIIK